MCVSLYKGIGSKLSLSATLVTDWRAENKNLLLIIENSKWEQPPVVESIWISLFHVSLCVCDDLHMLSHIIFPGAPNQFAYNTISAGCLKVDRIIGIDSITTTDLSTLCFSHSQSAHSIRLFTKFWNVTHIPVQCSTSEWGCLSTLQHFIYVSSVVSIARARHTRIRIAYLALSTLYLMWYWLDVAGCRCWLLIAYAFNRYYTLTTFQKEKFFVGLRRFFSFIFFVVSSIK